MSSGRLFKIVFGLVWLSVTTAGFYNLTSYSSTAGLEGSALDQWPLHATVQRPAGQAKLMMFAHPRCPCTRASIQELIRLVDRTESEATVVFWTPDTDLLDAVETAEWRTSETIQRVNDHPRLHAEFDPAGFNLKQFGVITSGHCLVYDGAGRLRFSGGITSGRGHEGANDSHRWIANLLNENTLSPRATVAKYPVFGCRIVGTDPF